MLTAVLFAQQAERFAEAVLYTDLPVSILGEIGAALIPGVLSFTIPLAALAGVIIGFARMGTDSEIVAMRAAGIGSWTMLWPVLLLGAVLSCATTFIHLREAPRAARDLERAALQGALAKLDSPVDPRNFNTLPRYVIYVRDGDKAKGIWGRVFIFTQNADHTTEVFTSRSGRIDSSGDQSELVLTDVLATKFPDDSAQTKQYVVERSDQLRISINTGRADIVQRLNQPDINADSMEWSDLTNQAQNGSAAEQRSAAVIMNRRLALSVAPLVFALLAGTLGLRVRRGGKSVGVLLSLIIAIVYYLGSLLGESLAKVGTVPPIVGAWLATALMLFLSLMFLLVGRVSWLSVAAVIKRNQSREAQTSSSSRYRLRIRTWGFPSLLDATLFRTLLVSFVLAFVALASIFNIFTLFELWRFIVLNNSSAALVGRYLFFLTPLVAVELFPATMLVAVLVTYALLARRHEAVAWWASGQSVYRLMLPGLIFALLISGCSWMVQEHLMPQSNVKQDALRAKIKGGDARATTGSGRQWLASTDTRRFYSYEFDETRGTLIEPVVYELDPDAVHLSKVVSGKTGEWTDPSHLKLTDTESLTLKGLEVERQTLRETTMDSVASPQVFRPTIDKPSQLSAAGLTSYLQAAKQRGVDVSALAVSLQRKYAGPFSVIIMAFIGMPLAASFGRRGAVIALCAAVVLSVAYWAVGGGFQQLGNHGLLRPSVAGWSPLVIFTAAGTYFLSRVRT